MQSSPQAHSSRSDHRKSRIPRNPWRHIPSVLDTPNMSREAIERRYRALGVEIGPPDASGSDRNLYCFAHHSYPTVAVVVNIVDDPPGTDWPVPLCEFHDETYPPGHTRIPADQWEGPLGRQPRVVPPEQTEMDL